MFNKNSDNVLSFKLASVIENWNIKFQHICHLQKCTMSTLILVIGLKERSEISRNWSHEYTWNSIKQALNVEVLKCTKENPLCISTLLKVQIFMCMHLPSLIGHYLWEPMAGDGLQCSAWGKLSHFKADQTMEYSAWSGRKCRLHTASSRTKCWPYANTNCCHQKIEQAL